MGCRQGYNDWQTEIDSTFMGIEPKASKTHWK
jgi:hypothetical protein